jgi:tetratricopeptide (TPR) repeat protein
VNRRQKETEVWAALLVFLCSLPCAINARARGNSSPQLSTFQIPLPPGLAVGGAALSPEGERVAVAFVPHRRALADQQDIVVSVRIWNVGTQEPIGSRQVSLRRADASLAVRDVASLKVAGKAAEAARVKDGVRMLETSAGTLEKVQLAMQAGEQAFKERRFDEAEKSYKETVALAEHLPPGDENLIVALGRLGNAYGMRQDYTDAEAAFHRQLAIIEKTFGPTSQRMTDPLFFLGSIAAGLKDYTTAESYFQRALDINLKIFGENSTRTSESLSAMAGLYMAQSDWSKAESYLLRAIKGSEAAAGPDDNMVLVPLWGMCDLYDRWGKPEKSQPCWHRATELMEKQVGVNSPDLGTSLTNEANAFRRLGRKSEADQLVQRLARIQLTASQMQSRTVLAEPRHAQG